MPGITEKGFWHLTVRSGKERFAILPLTRKKVKPLQDSVLNYHVSIEIFG